MILENFKGINNTANVNKTPQGYLRECVNFDVNKNGMLTQRFGYAQRDDGVFTCIGGDDKRCFAVRGGHLVEITENNTQTGYDFTVLRSNTGSVVLDFTECDGNYYYVSGSVNGVIKGGASKSFGLPSVAVQPTLSEQNTGFLNKGTYLVACTFLDSSGLESGTSAPVAVTLSGNDKKIALSSIPTSANADVDKVAIYASTKDGSVLYRQGTVNNGVTTFNLTDVVDNTIALRSVGINPSPYGSLIAYHYGHLYIANGAYLFYSENKVYHWWRPENNYKFPSVITGIMPCENGLWIATLDGLYWINGKQPNHGLNALGDFINFKKSDAVMQKGAEQKIPAEYLGTGTYGYITTTDKGIFILADNGQFVNATVENVKIPAFESCVSAVIDNGDTLNYLGIISGASILGRTI